MRKTPKTILGLTGDAASGKDTVASLFEKHGFYHQSTSDLVREEIASRGLITSRQLQTEVANELREKAGGEYFVIQALDLAIRRVGYNRPLILSGLYAPIEGMYLIENLGGQLVSVVGQVKDDVTLRYERLVKRADSSRDQMTLEDFIAAHERENSGNHPSQANLRQLREMAQFTIINSGNLEHLEAGVLEIIEQVDPR